MGRHRVKARKVRAYKTPEEYDLSPHENLAVAIVRQAVTDAQTLMDGGKFWGIGGNNVGKWELLNFFCSRWCGTLLGTTDLDGEEIAERIGLYDFCCR